MNRPSPAETPRRSGLETAVQYFIVVGSLSYLFFGILGLVSPETILKVTSTNGPVNAAATTFVHIFVARNLPIAVLPLAFLATKQTKALGYTVYFLAATQAIDFIFSVGGNSLLTVVASGSFTVLFALAGWYLLRCGNPGAAHA